jgi:pyruvate/2-oxoglutarate dehydrogenase complex dihydrolipoamide acyltransferase (E2) component
MITPVVLPKLGFAMLEGTIAEWTVADGSLVKEGDVIYSIESEKSVQEVQSPANGRIRILASTGNSLPVGTVVAQIAEE